MSNYDLKIQSSSGDAITFYGSKNSDDGRIQYLGYSSITGLGDPGRRTNSTVKSGADGGIVVAGDQQYSQRVISIDGFAVLKSNDDIRSTINALRLSMPIRQMVMAYVYAPSGMVYGIRAIVSTCTPKLVFSRGNNLVIDLDVDLTCPDPYWQDYQNNKPNLAIINKVKSGGLVWGEDGLHWDNEGLPWNTGGDVPTVTNNGSTTVYPVVTIRGATRNPVIGNLTTGESIKVPISLTNSDVFVIDMDSETIELNGKNVSSALVDAGWWGLLPGINKLQYNSDSSNDTAVVEITWRDKYIEAF